MMWRRLLVLDLALVALLVWGVLRVQQSRKDFDATHRVEAVRAEKEPPQTLPAGVGASSTAEDWTDISVKDPFSFDRNDIAIVAPKQTPANQPKPVLFGVMAIGNERIAMLAPGQTGGRGSRPVKVGETLDSYWQVVEIQDRSVVVTAAGGARETIVLNDSAVQVPRSTERTIGSAQPPPVAVSAAPASPPPQPTASSAPAAQPSAQPAANQPSDDILLTPFGPVKRTKP